MIAKVSTSTYSCSCCVYTIHFALYEMSGSEVFYSSLLMPPIRVALTISEFKYFCWLCITTIHPLALAHSHNHNYNLFHAMQAKQEDLDMYVRQKNTKKWNKERTMHNHAYGISCLTMHTMQYEYANKVLVRTLLGSNNGEAAGSRACDAPTALCTFPT